MVKTIALTGGIGCGKSTVLASLRERGYVVCDADQLAREVVLLPHVKQCITTTLGADLYTPDGQQLDRAKVGQLVFADPAKRQALEAITHPAIAQLFVHKRDALQALSPQAWLFYEASLIFEAGRQADFDAVVLVTARPEVRTARLMAGRGLSEAHIARVMAAQWPEERKSALAHHVLDNSELGPAQLEEHIAALLQALRARFYPPVP